MDFLQKEVNRFGVNATLRQLKDYHSSLRVKKPQQLRFLNKQTMRFGMYSNIAGTITRRKPHLSKKLDQHLVRLIKHYQRNPRDNMRTYTAKNIMPLPPIHSTAVSMGRRRYFKQLRKLTNCRRRMRTS